MPSARKKPVSSKKSAPAQRELKTQRLELRLAPSAKKIIHQAMSVTGLAAGDIAYEGDAPVGIATWYWTYSSFAARRGIYLEDLFVPPATRGKGYGKALLVHLAKTAVGDGGGHVEWEVLDWNKPSIDFYESLGAKRGQGWFNYRLSDDALKDLAR